MINGLSVPFYLSAVTDLRFTSHTTTSNKTNVNGRRHKNRYHGEGYYKTNRTLKITEQVLAKTF